MRERGLKAGERGVELALGHLHVADPFMRDGEVALPSGIVGIGLGQPLGNRERGLEAVERGVEPALGHLHVAQLVVRDGEVALPSGIVGIGLGQPL